MATIFALLGSVPVVAAPAPDSIAGKVYRDSFSVASLRGAYEKTIIFEDDDRFTFLKMATAVFVGAPQLANKVLLQSPRGEGRYVYRKTSESSASIDLQFDDGKTDSLTLTFTSETAGQLGPIPNMPDLTFRLVDKSLVKAAPVSNISMRARVAQNQSAIVGFVVPGARGPNGTTRSTAPGATERDVLIRAVGPSLEQFGVLNAWADPEFQLFDGERVAAVQQFQYGDWSSVPDVRGDRIPSSSTAAAFQKIFDYVGAFPLLNGSKDAAAVVRLAPGAYTVVAMPQLGDTGGEALIEVYFLP